MYNLIYAAVASFTVGMAPGAPAYLGTYETEAACLTAVREIYKARIAQVPDNKKEVVEKVIATTMKYQREYICVKKD